MHLLQFEGSLHLCLSSAGKQQSPPVGAGLLVGGTKNVTPPYFTLLVTIQLGNTTRKLLALLEQNRTCWTPASSTPGTPAVTHHGLSSGWRYPNYHNTSNQTHYPNCFWQSLQVNRVTPVPCIQGSPNSWLPLVNPHILWSDRLKAGVYSASPPAIQSILQSSSHSPSEITTPPVNLSLVPTELW